MHIICHENIYAHSKPLVTTGEPYKSIKRGPNKHFPSLKFMHKAKNNKTLKSSMFKNTS